MLLIGDVHITTKRQESILEAIRWCIDRFPNEREIIFMGDFVYQFSYERKPLLALFHLFADLYKQGKQVYILAGNHDWIADHFVYEEAKQAFDLHPRVDTHWHLWSGILKFITQPTFAQIQGQDILFFPFTHHLDVQEEEVARWPFASLAQSTHRNERLSAKANTLLRNSLQEWRSRPTKSATLLVIHHRYIVDTAFPWQQAKFSYASPGLSKELLEMDDVRLISWHLHQAFTDRNYLCTWSVWHTSSLEINQQKRCFQLDASSLALQAMPCTVNPYISRDVQTQPFDDEQFSKHCEQVIWQASSLLQAGRWNVNILPFLQTTSKQAYTLILKAHAGSYQHMDNYIDTGLLHQLRDVKVKSISPITGGSLTDLETQSLALDRSINDWKTLLRDYLPRKYGDRAHYYEKFLQDIHVL